MFSMNWLKKILGLVGSFFKRAALTALGVAVNELEEVATEVVRTVEEARPDLSGKEKYDIVFQKIKTQYPSIQTAVINLAIELAVAIIKDQFAQE